MIETYYEELGESIPDLNKKQVKQYENYIKKYEIQTSDFIEKIDEWLQETPYSDNTKRKYKQAMKEYIARINWK